MVILLVHQEVLSRIQRNNSSARESEANSTSWMNSKTLMMLDRWEMWSMIIKQQQHSPLLQLFLTHNKSICKISSISLQTLKTITGGFQAVSRIRAARRRSTPSCKTWPLVSAFSSTTSIQKRARSVSPKSMIDSMRHRLRQQNLQIMICSSSPS